MRLTKFSHSCVRFDVGDRTLVIDPGVYSETREALDGADAVLITHEHPDHLDAAAVRAAVAANSGLQVFAPAGVVRSLADLGDRVSTAEPGQQFTAAGFAIEAFGGQHALIHPSIPIVANVGYLVEGKVYHPGDSLIVPPTPVDTLLLPLSAPWSKLSEVIDFAVAVRAPHVHQIHDGLLHERAFPILEGNLERLTAPFGIGYRHLAPRESVHP